MGILSSLFGIGGGGKPATQTVVQAQKLPEEISPFVRQILSEAKDLYEAEIGRGYAPYTGLTTAPFTKQQLEAQAGLTGLVGTQRPFIEEALDIQREGAERFTSDVAEEYMSPYQRAVTDIEKREAQRTFEKDVMPQFEAGAVRAGGMSGLGTRAGVEAAELQRGQSQLLADIETRGLQSAYQDAQRQFINQKSREQQLAANIGRTGPALFGAGLAEAGVLEQVGAERRGLAQSALDEAYFKFLEEQQFPQRQLSQYSGTVYANPLSGMPTKTVTGTGTPYQPSTAQNLLGMGLTGLNIYGMGGGQMLGGTGFGMGNLYQNVMGGQQMAGYPKAKGGGSVGMLDKNLCKYMEQGSGAISASDRNRLMSLYKSGLSGLPVVRRQAGTQVMSEEDDFEGDIENIKITELFPYTSPSPPTELGKTKIPFMDQLARLQEHLGVQRINPEDLRRIYTDEKSSLEAALKSNREGSLADFAERRKAREGRTNPMARFVANQKAILALTRGEGGVDWPRAAGVFGEEHATLNEKQNALMNKLDDEEAAIKSGLRDAEHAQLIQSIKSDTQLQIQLLKLPESEMNKLLTGATLVGKLEELDASIIAKKQKALLARWEKEFKLDKAMTEKVKAVLDNADKISKEPDVFEEAVKLLMSHPMFKERGEAFVRSIVKEIAATHKVDGSPTGARIPHLMHRRSAEQLDKDLSKDDSK